MLRKKKSARFIDDREKKLHFFHIPKTAGRSVIAGIGCVAYPSLGHKEIYRKIVKQQIDINQEYISCMTHDFGEFFLTYGHVTFLSVMEPRWVINKEDDKLFLQIHGSGLNPDCFTFTVFRDPVERMFSRYKEYIQEMSTGVMPSLGIALKTDKEMSDEITFIEFMKELPTSLLYEQLYYFAVKEPCWLEEQNIKKAVQNVLSLNKVLFTETIDQDIKYISEHIGDNITLGEKFARNTRQISDEERAIATTLLETEYLFLELVKQGLNS